MKNKKIVFLILGFLVSGLIIAGGVAGYFYLQNNKEKDTEENDAEQSQNEEEENNIIYPDVENRFAVYNESTVTVTPSVQDYNVESGLSNVNIVPGLDLSQEVKDALEEDYFVVTPGESKEYFTVYEQNTYGQVPNFITTDSVLHTYHLIFDSTLKRLEQDRFIPIIKELAPMMVEEAQTLEAVATSEDFQTAAKRNVAFFSVGAKLIDPTFEIPEEVQDEVNAELDYIEAHQGIEVSPVMAIGFPNPEDPNNLKEDYSQYIPRGHYTKSEELKKYFKTMMWYGRITFLAKNETTTRSALLITNTLREEEIFDLWESIYEPINFFVGKADDLTFYDYNDLVTAHYGTSSQLSLPVLEDSTRFNNFYQDVLKLKPPQINSIPIFAPALNEDKEKEIKGYRFMGQRFTLDASIFQSLIYREVGNKQGVIPETPTEDTRMLPKGLDIPAAFGSDLALDILEEQGEFEYYKYEENLNKLRTEIASYDTDKWGQNLYWAWLYSLKALTDEKGQGYPQFMTSDKWLKKDLNTFLGSWTELKHDTILYAKQAMAELGGIEPEPVDFRGYVEPNIYVWTRMLDMVNMTEEGLSSRDLLTDTTQGDLDSLATTLEQLRDISVKELQEEDLTEDEYDFIKNFGGTLETLFLNSIDGPSDKYSALDENPAPVVADVATDPNGAVLEEGTGYIFVIYVIVPVDGELKVAKGGIYSQYEFTVGLSERMTDEEWRERLSSGDYPEMEDWKMDFIVE